MLLLLLLLNLTVYELKLVLCTQSRFHTLSISYLGAKLMLPSTHVYHNPSSVPSILCTKKSKAKLGKGPLKSNDQLQTDLQGYEGQGLTLSLPLKAHRPIAHDSSYLRRQGSP